ncbi:MAG: hypothetical protein ABIA59_07670 [Candidatus Latescibacterota bacterium]
MLRMNEVRAITVSRVFVILCWSFFCVNATAWPQAPRSVDRSHIGVKHPPLLKMAKNDSCQSAKPDSAGSPLHESFLRSAGFNESGMAISSTASLFYRYEKYQLTRFDCVMEGAQAGAKIGLFLSAVGTTAGMWDEKSSWYLVGALSALGALLSGTTMDDEPQWRMRLHWEPDRSIDRIRAFE